MTERRRNEKKDRERETERWGRGMEWRQGDKCR